MENNIWFEKLDDILFKYILEFQKNIEGNNFEIGVFEGDSLKSIALYDTYNITYGLDIFNDNFIEQNYYEKCLMNLKGINNIELIKEDSTKYDFSIFENKIKFCHIDGCHNGKSVLSDVKNANKIINEQGILVIDDWNNSLFPDIKTGFYMANTDFVPFCISINKAYFCRKTCIDKYLNFILYTYKKVNKELPFIRTIEIENSIFSNYIVFLNHYYTLSDKIDYEYIILYN